MSADKGTPLTVPPPATVLIVLGARPLAHGTSAIMVSRAMGSNRRNDALASSHFKKRRELLNIIIVNSLRNSCKREGTQTRVEIETTLIRYCILERDLSNANTKNLLGTRSSTELGCRTGEKRWQR